MEKDPAMTPLARAASLVAIAAALATAACNRSADAPEGNTQAQFALPALPATLPLEPGAATPIEPAPSASDLPDARPLKLAQVADQSQAYGYADAAYSYDEALGDAPPDYGFDYEGTDPWAWQGYDDSLMVAEPIDDGYRYYYYRPGAEEPYFVRDPWYSYGFAGGMLAVVYAADGGIVPYADYGPRLGYASRYYARGRSLWGASRRGTRRAVIAANWVRQRPVIFAARERWGAGRAHQPGWQRFYDANRPRQASYWRTEQLRRQADSRRFADWRQQGFRSAPPPRAIPVAWQGAKWARDNRRYRPAAEAIRERREDRQQADRREVRQERIEDRRQQQARADRQEQREQRQLARDRNDGQREQRQQAQQREAAQAQRQAERQAQREQAGRGQRQQAQQREARQAERQQAQAGERRQQQQAERAQQRQQADAERQAQQREARQAERAQRQQAAEGGRRQAEQAQRQAERAQRQQAEQASRRQAEQAQRQQAQQAERQAQRQQAQQAERQAQRQQAQQAERQAQQAQRQAQQAQRQQAQQAERQAQRQQMQQARQAERQAQPRGDRGGGGRRGGNGPD